MDKYLAQNNMEMGSNDLYVIKKLRDSDITLEKIEAYLRKVYSYSKEVHPQ